MSAQQLIQVMSHIYLESGFNSELASWQTSPVEIRGPFMQPPKCRDQQQWGPKSLAEVPRSNSSSQPRLQNADPPLCPLPDSGGTDILP